MLEWIRKKLCPKPNKLIAKPDGTKAQVVVVYNLLEGSGFDSLQCITRSSTWFADDADEAAKQVANTASRILSDRQNIEVIYTSVLSNMLHVPPELRKRPN